MPIDLTDPLGINHLLAARSDWDARYPIADGPADDDGLLPIERETVEAIQRRQTFASAAVKTDGNCEDRQAGHLTEDDEHD